MKKKRLGYQNTQDLQTDFEETGTNGSDVTLLSLFVIPPDSNIVAGDYIQLEFYGLISDVASISCRIFATLNGRLFIESGVIPGANQLWNFKSTLAVDNNLNIFVPVSFQIAPIYIPPDSLTGGGGSDPSGPIEGFGSNIELTGIDWSKQLEIEIWGQATGAGVTNNDLIFKAAILNIIHVSVSKDVTTAIPLEPINPFELPPQELS